MSKEKQIDEMAKLICTFPHCINYNIIGGCKASECNIADKAEAIYNAGYRKQSKGHWFILEYEYFTCSECGYYHPNGCDSTQEAKEKLAGGKVPKYCSECGAKMKGGAE